MENDNELKNIAQALIKAQIELANPEKNAKSYKFKYADLPSILDKVKPVLANHGLAIAQMPYSEGDLVGVRTMLLHSSGEYLESLLTMPVDSSVANSRAQAIGTVITYARRYALSAMLNIAAEDDTDAEIQSEKESKKIAEPKMSSYDKAKAEARGERDVAIAKTEAGHGDIAKSDAEVGADGTLFASENQLKRMYAIAFDVGVIVNDDPVKTYRAFQETIKDYYGLMSSKTIPLDKYERIIADLDKKRVK